VRRQPHVSGQGPILLLTHPNSSEAMLEAVDLRRKLKGSRQAERSKAVREGLVVTSSTVQGPPSAAAHCRVDDQQRRRRVGSPETFSFLGFTHIGGLRLNGEFKPRT
jgi:hypothetical protein